jgi:hypothetical protein
LPAGPAGCQLTHTPPRLPTSQVSPTATWANVVRGGACARVEGPACPTPAVSTPDFQSLYERCLASGFKARVIFNHVAGLQTATVSCSLPSCSLPSSSSNAATAVNPSRCRCHRRRRRRGRAAFTSGANSAHPPSTATTVPAVATRAGEKPCTPTPNAVLTTPRSPQRLAFPLPSPEIVSPPAKRTRKWRTEVELLRGLEEEGEFLVSPLSGAASPPSFSPPSPSSRHTPPTASLLVALPPVLTPVRLNLEPVSPTPVTPAPPTFPATPPLVVTPPVAAMLAGPSSPSPLPSSSSSPPSSPSPLPSPSPAPPPAPPPSSPSPSPSTPQSSANIIPPALPMSIHFPSACFKVICRICFRNSHNI